MSTTTQHEGDLMTTATKTNDPESPEAQLAIVEPQWQALCEQARRLEAEDAQLRASVLEMNTASLRVDWTQWSADRRDELVKNMQRVDGQLFANRGHRDSIERRVHDLRAAVAGGAVASPETLQAKVEAAEVEVLRIADELAAAMQAREDALEGGTADELLVAERRVRRLPGELHAAQRESLACRLAMIDAATQGLGRKDWNAARAVEAAAVKVADAQAAHTAALEAARAVVDERSYLVSQSERLHAELAGIPS